MAARLNPYISFVDNAREAMEFYRSVFGGELEVMTFEAFGPPPGVNPDAVMHSMLVTDAGFSLMAADTPPDMDRTVGNNIVVSVSGDEPERLRGYWTALADGARIETALEKQMWGDEFGALEDKFGVNWCFNIGEPA